MMLAFDETLQRVTAQQLPTRPPAPTPPSRASAVLPVRRSGILIATFAVLGALWLGLTAPAVSPVAGPTPVAPAVVQDAVPPAITRPDTVVQPPVLPAGPGAPGRRGRR